MFHTGGDPGGRSSRFGAARGEIGGPAGGGETSFESIDPGIRCTYFFVGGGVGVGLADVEKMLVHAGAILSDD